MRVVRDQLIELHDQARNWTERTRGIAVPETECYVDLIFAYGMARFDERIHAERLRDLARSRMLKDDVHSWLFRAFDHRIQQAIDGERAAGQLPAELLEELDVMDRMERYKADRLRQHSVILEPHERIEPYRRWHQRHSDDLGRSLAEIADIRDAAVLSQRLDELLTASHKPADAARVLTTAMELCPRLGEATSQSVLPLVSPLMGKLADPVDRATLLERALFLAAHFDRQREIEAFLAELRNLLHRKVHTSLHTIEKMEAVLAQSFRGLRRMGMRDGISQLLEDLDALVRDFEKRTTRGTSNTGKEEEPLLVLMQVAAGWLYFGREENAWPILDRVRAILFTAGVKPARKVQLASGYLNTLSQAPVESALPRMVQLFEQLDGISGGYTTNSHYGLPQIDIVEAAIRAMVSDDFNIDKQSRRWMDDDEYLVRRRIHRDVRAMTK